MLKNKLKNNEAGILLYGLTPPKAHIDESEKQRIAGIWKERVESIGVDGIVLYDLQDESDRNNTERTFEFLQTLSPEIYYQNYLKTSVPAIIYKAVSKYERGELKAYLNGLKSGAISVFVGVSSKDTPVKTSLDEAYEIANKTGAFFGGICIPERHAKKHDEHLRVAKKIENGCEFFITQAVYNLENAKNFIDDYAKMPCKKAPIIFTFTPCGSEKTLEFIKWLGISVPQSYENMLKSSNDILNTSVDLSLELFNFLYKYAANKGISVGANVESISTRKVEILAALNLLDGIKKIIKTSPYSYTRGFIRGFSGV